MQPIARQPSREFQGGEGAVREAPMGRMAGSAPSSPRERVAAAARVLEQPAPRSNCQVIRHWSEIPVIGMGVLGCAMLGMGVFGSGTLFYVTGGLNLGAAIPVYPILRRYGTVRQQVAILEGVIQQQRETIREIALQLEALSAEVNALGENESEISEHVEVIQEGIERLQHAAGLLGERILVCRQQRDQLSRDVQDQSRAIGDLEEALEARNAELHALKETAEALTRRPAQILEVMQGRLEALERLSDRISAVRPSLEQERDLLQAYGRATEQLADSEAIRVELTHLQRQVGEFLPIIERLEEQKEAQLARMARERDAVEEALPAVRQMIQELEQTLQHLQSRNEAGESSQT
jgi:chromosome segregation ATPase